MNTPPAEIAIDAELAERLVREQHPDLAGGLTLVASGWDNTLYRLGDRLVLRLPRRQVAADLVLNEHRWLPAIAERISVHIPAPLRLRTCQDPACRPARPRNLARFLAVRTCRCSSAISTGHPRAGGQPATARSPPRLTRTPPAPALA
jgi:hypothetical protein